jgi:hypothetical protein
MLLACFRIGLRSSASMSSWVSRCSNAPVLLTARLLAAAARESGRSTMANPSYWPNIRLAAYPSKLTGLGAGVLGAVHDRRRHPR